MPTSTVSDVYNCNGGIPGSDAYTFPTAGATSYTPLASSIYELIGFSSDYKTSDTASCWHKFCTKGTSGNSLGKAIGGIATVAMVTNVAGQGTGLAGAIYAAHPPSSPNRLPIPDRRT